MDRDIRFIVVHCTATDQYVNPNNILRYWREHLGWKNPGYHYLIEPSGTVLALHSEFKLSNGVRGYNKHSVHVAYVGGIGHGNQPEDNRTEAQKLTLLNLLKVLKNRYPGAVVLGHRDFPHVAKACPSFDAKSEYSTL